MTKVAQAEILLSERRFGITESSVSAMGRCERRIRMKISLMVLTATVLDVILVLI